MTAFSHTILNTPSLGHQSMSSAAGPGFPSDMVAMAAICLLKMSCSPQHQILKALEIRWWEMLRLERSSHGGHHDGIGGFHR